MAIITPNIDARPYTGIRKVKGKVRLKTHEEAPYLDEFFNGTPHCEQVTGLTRGKTYEATKVEGFGDCESITVIDDEGNEQTLSDFFFEEAEE